MRDLLAKATTTSLKLSNFSLQLRVELNFRIVLRIMIKFEDIKFKYG
jgi:hypothetical protein